MSARLLAAAVLCAAFASPLVAQQPDTARRPIAAGRFVGEVRSITTTLPVEAADIRLMFVDSAKVMKDAEGRNYDELFVDTTKSRIGVTNAEGKFTIRGVSAGHYVVNVRRIGFEPFEGVLTLDTAMVEMELALTQIAAVLPRITISASATNRVTERLDRMGFTTRYRLGTSGTFVTRADILRRKPVYVTDILETYGVRRDADIVIDRMPADWELLQHYPADLVIGIEIYRRRTSLPQEFNITKMGSSIMTSAGQATVTGPTVVVWTFIP